LSTLALVLLGGLWLDQREVALPAPAPAAGPDAGLPAELRLRFNQAVVMLHAKQYDHAATALHRVLVLAPQMPEAHVNMGFALLGLQRAAEARAFFDGALALRPEQANAYYGLALAWEAQGDRAMALGAMRSYVHLGRHESPAHLARARAALWEWQASTTARR
jgi:predicted Zn-dependent protease